MAVQIPTIPAAVQAIARESKGCKPATIKDAQSAPPRGYEPSAVRSGKLSNLNGRVCPIDCVNSHKL